MTNAHKFEIDLRQASSILAGLTARASKDDALMEQFQKEMQAVLATARLVVVSRDGPQKSALALTAYPPQPNEVVDWSGPLYDSEGYPHTLLHLGGIQVVTRVSFVCVVWDRKTGKSVGTGEEQSISNTPMSEEERARRKAEVLARLRNDHSQGTQELLSRLEGSDIPRPRGLGG